MYLRDKVKSNRIVTGRARDSTLDLVWMNYATSLQNIFHGVQIGWAGSLSSDHTLIRTLATTLHKARAR